MVILLINRIGIRKAAANHGPNLRLATAIKEFWKKYKLSPAPEVTRAEGQDMIYRVAFTGRGAEYTRCFTSKEERDRFAESMRQAGYKVHTWE